MIDLQIKNTDDSGGMKRGIHYYPYVNLSKYLQVGLTKRSDGTTDADGILYPSNLNNNSNVGQIQSFLTSLSNVSGQSTNDEIFSNNQTKILVGSEWFSKYKRMINTSIMSGIKGRQNAVPNSIDGNSGPFKLIELDSTRAMLLYKPGGTGLYAIVLKRGSGEVITYGTPAQIHSGNVGMSKENVDGVLINTDKVMVVNSYDGNGYILSVSDVTITVSSPAGGVVQHSGGGTTCCICKLDTDKVVVTYYDSSSTASYAKCATITGTSIGPGAEVNIGSSQTNPYVLGNSTSDAFVILKSGSGVKGRVLSISGTTITANTAADVLTTGYVDAKHRYVKLASNKFLVLTTNDKGVVITVSGTGFSTVSNNLTTGIISVDGNSKGAMIEITTNTTYQYYEGVGNGNGIKVRILTISGTTVTDGTAETLTNDSNFLSEMVACAWGSAIGIAALNNNGNQMSLWIAAAGTTTYEIYNDATLVGGTRTDNFSFVLKTISVDANVNSKKMYFGIKNTSGASRYISLSNLTVEVK